MTGKIVKKDAEISQTLNVQSISGKEYVKVDALHHAQSCEFRKILKV